MARWDPATLENDMFSPFFDERSEKLSIYLGRVAMEAGVGVLPWSMISSPDTLDINWALDGPWYFKIHALECRCR